jgi:hypothetical protein
MKKLTFTKIFPLIFIILLACGPIEYMSQVGIKSRRAFTSARKVNSKKYSPYEYWSAYYYLNRARYVAQWADYQNAVNYGKTSELMSKKAETRSLDKKKIDLEEQPEKTDNPSSKVKIDLVKRLDPYPEKKKKKKVHVYPDKIKEEKGEKE